MITRLEVDGFKSLRDFSVDLEPCTVLIGPNSAGKSNLLEALGLLSRLMKMPISKAFQGGRGGILDQFSRTGDRVADRIRFGVEFLVVGTNLNLPGSQEQSRWRYELGLVRQPGHGVSRIVVDHEALSPLTSSADQWFDERPELSALGLYGSAAGGPVFLRERTPESGRLQFLVHPVELRDNLPDDQLGLSQLLLETTPLVLLDLEGLRSLSPDSVRVRDDSERTDSEMLADDGANLPTILASLPENVQGGIRADLARLVPGLGSFELIEDPLRDTLAIHLVLSGGERLPARLASGGTLRILLLLTALRAQPRPSVLLVEEPENGVYPGKLRELLALLAQHSDPASLAGSYNPHAIPGGTCALVLPTQILLTTHSPVALSTFRATPRPLRFVDLVRRENGRATRARRVAERVAARDAATLVSRREIERLLQSTFRQEGLP